MGVEPVLYYVLFYSGGITNILKADFLNLMGWFFLSVDVKSNSRLCNLADTNQDLLDGWKFHLHLHQELDSDPIQINLSSFLNLPAFSVCQF